MPSYYSNGKFGTVDQRLESLYFPPECCTGIRLICPVISETKLESRKVSEHTTTGEFNVKMSWKPTLGLSKLSSSLLSTVCLPHNNAFFNYFTLVLFPGAHMCSIPVGRELSLLAKSPEDAGPGWLEGWLSLPLLPPSTVHVVGFRGCSSVLGFIQGRRISHPQEATQKKKWCSHLLCLSANQFLFECCEHKLCCHDPTQGICAVSHCYVTATCAHRTYFVNQVDQFIEVKVTDNVPKHGSISLSALLL